MIGGNRKQMLIMDGAYQSKMCISKITLSTFEAYMPSVYASLQIPLSQIIRRATVYTVSSQKIKIDAIN